MLRDLDYSDHLVKKAFSLLVRHGWMKRLRRGEYSLFRVEEAVMSAGLCGIARLAAEKLSELSGVHGVMVVGSIADGVATRSSDIDLIVVCDEKDWEECEEILASVPYCGDSPLVISPEDFVDELRRGNPNIVSYLREGEVLYDDGFLSKLVNQRFSIDLRYAEDSFNGALSAYEHLVRRRDIRRDAYFRVLRELIYADLILHGFTLHSMTKMLELFCKLHPELNLDGNREAILRCKHRSGEASINIAEVVGIVVERTRKEWKNEVGGTTTQAR